MKTSIVSIAMILTVCLAFGQQGGNEVFRRKVFDGQALTTAGASNSVPIVVSGFNPVGYFAAEVRIYGTGTVDYVSAQVSNDGTTWYTVHALTNNVAVAIDSGDPATGFVRRLLIPPSLHVRLTAAASVNTPMMDAWLIIH